ncbi:FimD/PapC C-terminal domain-containing protein, partial [Burkholderia ubonensis]|uniref:FimD/PapC C-terminal domain-containing protein n=1 Tax=Burkholderia ubonensis TaxID=101571 RepID=UPI000A4F019B
AYDEQDEVISMANKLSCLLVFGIEDKGSIDVQWGDKQCTIGYALKPQNKELTYERQAASCVRSAMVTSVR